MKFSYSEKQAKTPIIRATMVTDRAGSVIYTIKGEALNDDEKRTKFSLITDNSEEFHAVIEDIKNNYDAQIVRICTGNMLELME
jgi:acetolactate synthase regulatory subunit